MFAKIRFIVTSQFGLYPGRMIRSLLGLPRYVRDLFRFRAGYKGPMGFAPCLHDWSEEGGTTRDEYFWQDLLVARMIFEARPRRHVDIGSRVDGFVAHVASFREIEIFDVRPITTSIPGVVFKQADLMKPLVGMEGYCDSLSCLHALEHFGLGRYGDPVDPKGFEQGLTHMACLLKDGGTFYLSVPIGRGRVEFNAHRVFDPRVIIDLAAGNALQLSAVTVIRDNNKIEALASWDASQLSRLAQENYVLGIFTFVTCARENK